MPKRSTHDIFAATGGAVVGLKIVTGQNPAIQLLEIGVTVLASMVGARIPDLVEPGIHPFHRGFAHAAIPATTAYIAGIARARVICGERASACRHRASLCAAGSAEQSNQELTAIFWSLLAAALAGFAYGYLSHIALDALTPRSVPLFTRGL